MSVFRICFALSCLLGAAGAGAAEFRELAWLDPEADALRQLSTSPLECLAVQEQPDDAYRVEAGRQLFRNPAVLGGRAAELGLNCNACHPAGKADAAFYLDGLSDGPGRVDVSNDLFSKTQADDRLDPVAIAELTDLAQREGFATQEARQAYVAPMLDGVEDASSAAAAAALAAYLGALSSTACPEQQQNEMTHTVGQQLYEIARAADVLQEAARRGDDALLDLLILAVQDEIALLQRRYDVEATRETAARITASSEELDALRGSQLSPDELDSRLAEWRRNWEDLRPMLLMEAEDSLYRRALLEQWLQANR